MRSLGSDYLVPSREVSSQKDNSASIVGRVHAVYLIQGMFSYDWTHQKMIKLSKVDSVEGSS